MITASCTYTCVQSYKHIVFILYYTYWHLFTYKSIFVPDIALRNTGNAHVLVMSSRARHRNQLPHNLPQLQNLIKRDPVSYKDEVRISLLTLECACGSRQLGIDLDLRCIQLVSRSHWLRETSIRQR